MYRVFWRADGAIGMKGPSGESLETTENGTEGGRSGAGIGGKVRASGPKGEPPAFFDSQEVSGERL